MVIIFGCPVRAVCGLGEHFRCRPPTFCPLRIYYSVVLGRAPEEAPCFHVVPTNSTMGSCYTPQPENYRRICMELVVPSDNGYQTLSKNYFVLRTRSKLKACVFTALLARANAHVSSCGRRRPSVRDPVLWVVHVCCACVFYRIVSTNSVFYIIFISPRISVPSIN